MQSGTFNMSGGSITGNRAEAAGGGDYFYTTYIDYEWTVGKVNIFVTMSDLYTGDVPADMSFRVFITEQ